MCNRCTIRYLYRHQTRGTDMTINTGDIVKGKVCGTFVVIGMRQIDGEEYAQVKEYDVVTGKAKRGEFALPIATLIKE